MSVFQEPVDSRYILSFYHSKEPKKVNPFQELCYKNEACFCIVVGVQLLAMDFSVGVTVFLINE